MTTRFRKPRNWLIVLALLGIAAFGVEAVLDNFHEVIPGEVYRSAQLNESEFRDVVEANGIRSVINLRGPDRGREQEWHIAEKGAAEDMGVAFYEVDLKNQNLRVDEVRDLRAILESAERPVYFHCRSGMDRSGVAAVMSLLMAGETDLDEVKKQTSWRYLVYKPDSVGKTFLASYRDWLADNGGEHSPALFDRWLAEDYVDDTGNIHYLVDKIEGELWYRPRGRYDDGVSFEVDPSAEGPFTLSGWAFDTGSVQPLAGVRVRLGEGRWRDANYGHPRKENYFSFGKSEYIETGWLINYRRARLQPGCHDLSLAFVRQDGTEWQSDREARICVDG